MRNAHRLLAFAAFAAFSSSPAVAQITVGELDDFQDGTNEGWVVGLLFGQPVPVPTAPDAGPGGVGDHALHMDVGVTGGGRLLVINATQWAGDWTGAGVAQIGFDVRNPNDFDLTLRLGVAGPGGAGGGGSGDTYVTEGIPVPADDAWHSIAFDVLPSDFVSTGGMDINLALADVSHFRIIHSVFASFTGEFGGAFYLDNITAIGAPENLPGDYNGNGTVDAADYVVWRQSNGQSGAGLAADGTGPGGMPDGMVDNLDFEFWRAQFGNSQSGGGHEHGLGAIVATVPEPASALLLGGAGWLVLAVASRRNDRGKEPAN